jgi:hypothetical protein
MPAIVMSRFDAIRSQLQTMQKRDLGESSRRTDFVERRVQEQVPKKNPMEPVAEERLEPPTDFTRALGLVESLRTQIKQNPVSSLTTATANLDENVGARQILSQVTGPENATRPR